MRLDYVEICGFRGIREKVRVTFGSGFTVITGRNGVGKSTIFDAVEFALTGLIDKYADKKSANESLGDYLWWRGNGSPSCHYVTISFRRDDGEGFSITRKRESGADRSQDEIEEALCYSTKPDDAIGQLCKSSIIRDEWISELSLDLKEIDRYQRVHSIIGPIQKNDLDNKAKEIIKHLEGILKQKEDVLKERNMELSNAVAKLSDAKAIKQTDDASDAKEILDAAIPDSLENMAERVLRGRSILAEGRIRLKKVKDMISQGRNILELRRKFDDPDALKKREAMREQYEAANNLKIETDNRVTNMRRTLELGQDANTLAASLALIIEHGEKLGLQDEHCPLCAAARTEEEFEEGLVLARERVQRLAAGYATAREQMREAEEIARKAAAEQEKARSQWSEIEEEQEDLISLEQEHVENFERYGLDLSFVKDPDGLEKFFSEEEKNLVNLERALDTLEVYQSISGISALEKRVEELQEKKDSAEHEVENCKNALETVKKMKRNVSSISGEITQERLNQISPILNNLYERLRPHHERRSIEYSLRGKIQRYLSLRVGEGINPQFVFSSGQRRAAGLAFLLAVHLARSWTPWRTLLLDDPVQHIDDFRAIHLVEVLAAIRLGGRQIVCSVEDSALADVLCRRLSGASDGMGRRYDLEIGKDGAATIKSEREIPPMPQGIMRSGTEIHLIN